jgi:hypothetical protein
MQVKQAATAARTQAAPARRRLPGWVWLVAAAAPVYGGLIRPWMLAWGAGPDEIDAALPGDELVPQPRNRWTRAITIDAPPAAVWPWLVQIGQGRGGLYSYDWLENLAGCDIHSADRILPEYQNLQVGDPVRLVREGYPADVVLQVAQIVPEAALVLCAPGEREAALAQGLPYLSWAFVLQPERGDRTRLVVRTRSDFRPTLPGRLANQWLLEPIQFIMERKMLLGIKARAER